MPAHWASPDNVEAFGFDSKEIEGAPDLLSFVADLEIGDEVSWTEGEGDIHKGMIKDAFFGLYLSEQFDNSPMPEFSIPHALSDELRPRPRNMKVYTNARTGASLIVCSPSPPSTREQIETSVGLLPIPGPMKVKVAWWGIKNTYNILTGKYDDVFSGNGYNNSLYTYIPGRAS